MNPMKYKTLQHLDQANPVGNQLPKIVSKRPVSPEELLPGNENRKWAQKSKGKGELGDETFMPDITLEKCCRTKFKKC